MFTKILGAVVISVVSVVSTLTVQSVLGSHGTSAAGRPHQTTATPQPCTRGTGVPGTGVNMHGATGTVASVGANSFTITTPGGKTVTVNVSGNTKYRSDTSSASISSVTKGAVVIVRGTAVSGNSINENDVVIIPAHVAGKVTKIDGAQLTIQPVTGKLAKLASPVASVTTVITDTNTKYFAMGTANPGISSVKVGSYIMATGKVSEDGKSLTARFVMIAPAGFSLGNGGMAPHGMLRGILGDLGMGGGMGFHHGWMNGSDAPTTSTTA